MVNIVERSQWEWGGLRLEGGEEAAAELFGALPDGGRGSRGSRDSRSSYRSPAASPRPSADVTPRSAGAGASIDSSVDPLAIAEAMLGRMPARRTRKPSGAAGVAISKAAADAEAARKQRGSSGALAKTQPLPTLGADGADDDARAATLGPGATAAGPGTVSFETSKALARSYYTTKAQTAAKENPSNPSSSSARSSTDSAKGAAGKLGGSKWGMLKTKVGWSVLRLALFLLLLKFSLFSPSRRLTRARRGWMWRRPAACRPNKRNLSHVRAPVCVSLSLCLGGGRRRSTTTRTRTARSCSPT